jgi:hypothetical protein
VTLSLSQMGSIDKFTAGTSPTPITTKYRAFQNHMEVHEEGGGDLLR